jgi:uncharacterized protein (DUF952 family)
MSTILHITKRSAWEAAQAAGQYEADSLHSQGFIHCSRPDQVLAVADFLFRGQTGLVLLCIDADRVVPQIRCESPEGSEKIFPHIYGPLNLDAVREVYDFPPRPDGSFELPAPLSGRGQK